VEGEFDRIILCGMGGSSLYVDIINNYLADSSDVSIRIETVTGYSIPKSVNAKTLIIAASYSGNTEETISALEEALVKNLKIVIFAAGGKLIETAQEKNIDYFQIPSGLQPRLSTGYFIAGVLGLLSNSGIIPSKESEVLDAGTRIAESLDEEATKNLSLRVRGKVPVIYATDNNWSIARVSKIKFNENSKTQAFWNYFPELNHNEMVGFTRLEMTPVFLIYKSQFTNPRNHKRIEIFKKLLEEKGCDVVIIEMKGKNILEEILNAYFMIDHVTYYLAEMNSIDPEPVDMVEDFKKMLVE
jgi:glucose/mannose-6-phosphate isomerase